MNRALQIICLIFFTGAFSMVKSQITIDEFDMPEVNDLFFNAKDNAIKLDSTMFTNLSLIGNAGADQTWDLTWIHYDSLDTVLYIDPVNTPDYSLFPTSNLATNSVQNGTIYILKNFSIIEVVGAVVNTSFGTVKANLNQTILTLPNNYQSQFQDTSVVNFTTYFGQQYQGMQVDSLRYKSTNFINSLTDGWGIATTPHYSENVLRVKENTTTVDTMWAYSVLPFVGGTWFPVQMTVDSTVKYTWYPKLLGNPLAEISVKHDTITDAKFLLDPNALKINKIDAEELVNIYPNPSNNYITVISRENNCKLDIYNVAGQKCIEVTLNKKVTVDIENLDTGIYIYKVLDNNDNILEKGKLNIIH